MINKNEIDSVFLFDFLFENVHLSIDILITTMVSSSVFMVFTSKSFCIFV